MKKIITAMVLLMVIGLVLIGCTQTATPDTPAVDSSGFEEVSGDVDQISNDIDSLNLDEDLSFDDDLDFTGLDFEG